MKIKILIGVSVLVILGVAAFVVTGDGKKIDEEALNRMRGTEVYYQDSPILLAPAPYGEEEIMVNLADKKVLKLSFDLQYRCGMRWQEDPLPAQDALSKQQGTIRSRIIILLTSRKSTDMNGAKLQALLEEILMMINEVAFPMKEARAEEIAVKNIIYQ